jgi:hypothetical protein
MRSLNAKNAGLAHHKSNYLYKNQHKWQTESTLTKKLEINNSILGRVGLNSRVKLGSTEPVPQALGSLS